MLEQLGVGPKILRLIRLFWELAEMACKAAGNFGEKFKAERGVTQGGPLSARLFNIVVSVIVREMLRRLETEV